MKRESLPRQGPRAPDQGRRTVRPLPAGQSPTPPANSASSFPSLDFPPDRTVLHTLEVARRLNVSLQHVLDLIEAGKLRAVNVGGIGAKCRPYYRIPIEAWRAFVRQNTT